MIATDANSPEPSSGSVVNRLRFSPLLATGLLIAAVQLVVAHRYRGPAARPRDAPPAEFSAVRAVDALKRVLGDQSPHPSGSEANAAVRERILKELEAVGLRRADHIEVLHHFLEWPNDSLHLYNILVRLPGGSDERQPLVIATHYDSVEAGPGAGDAGACVAALIETARVLMGQTAQRQRPVYLLFTDGEEYGLLGAQEFVKSHPLAQRKPFVLNFDARGSAGASLLYETHANNLDVISLTSHCLSHPVTGSSFVTVYRSLPNYTDFTTFQADGWGGLNFAFIDGAWNYHTENDTLANLDLRSVQHHGENMVELASFLANRDDRQLPSGSNDDAVFFDLLSFVVVWFPARWAMPIALVTLLLTAVGCRKSFWSIGWPSLLCAIALGTSLAVATGCAYLADAIIRSEELAPRRFSPLRPLFVAGCWAVILLWSLTAVRWFVRRADAAHLWTIVWIGWSLLAVAVALWAPGFSYVVLFPAAAAAMLSLLPFDRRRLTIFSATIAAASLLPLIYLLPIALGVLQLKLVCPVIAFFVTAVYPVFSDSSGLPDHVSGAQS